MQAYHPSGNGLQYTESEKIESWKQFISKEIFTIPGHFAPSAWSEHIPFAFWLVQSLQPACLVELGTHYGVSYFAFCQAVKNIKLSTRCYAVDTWTGDEHAGFYNDDVFARVENNNEPFADFSTLYRLTFDEAVVLFENCSIDLLHIDGLHTYEAVKHDFENWLPKMSDKAVVLFHDIAVRGKDFGVYRLWEELKLQYASFEFEHGYGLGILAVGNQLPANALALFNLASQTATKDDVQHIYQRLGALYAAEQAAKLAVLNISPNAASEMAKDTAPDENKLAGHPGLSALDSLSIQIYLKEEHGIFTEKNSFSQLVQLKEEIVQVSIRATIPGRCLTGLKYVDDETSSAGVSAGAIKLRIDPATTPGVFYLHHVFVTGEDDTVLMNWEDIRRSCTSANLLLTKSTRIENAYLLVSLTGDPMIEFLLADSLYSNGENRIDVHLKVSGLEAGALQEELSRLAATALRS